MKYRNLQIDGLRGIAMLMIVTYHLFFRYGELFEYRTVSRAVEAMLPGLAVPIFLLVSSMFLIHTYQEREECTFVSRCLSLFFHKVRRLWPAYAIAVSIIVLVRLIIDLPGRGELSFVNYVCNLLMINGFIGRDYIDSAHWYITTLLSATAVTTIINCGFARRREEACLLWVLVSMVLHFIKGMTDSSVMSKILSAIYVCIGGQYVGIIVVGILIGIIIIGQAKTKWIHWSCVILCVAQTLLVRSTEDLLCIGIAAVIVVAVGKEKFRFLATRPLVALGTISYEVYLIHQNISFGLIHVMTNAGVSQIASAGCAYAISIAIGAMLHMFVKLLEKSLLMHQRLDCK